MSAAVSAAACAGARAAGARRRLRRGCRAWWPLAALTLLAAALRLSTLDLQSFWYDEAFTPVHVLHAEPRGDAALGRPHARTRRRCGTCSSGSTARVLGTGEVALRLPSALAGVATVPSPGRSAASWRAARAAIVCAALVAVNPLFVWYSQEARAYGLFVLIARARDAVLPARAARADAAAHGARSR